MEGQELDPYEKQLLAEFESCDQEQRGCLNWDGLEQLCEKLQLEEQGLELMEYLLGTTGRDSDKRVTFTEFRDGLLELLGEYQRDRQRGRDGSGRGSPEREVSPKFVFGQKKYGRRSRPESTELDEENSEDNLEDSDSEIIVSVEGEHNEIFMVCSYYLSSVVNFCECKTVDSSSAPASLGPLGEGEEEGLRVACQTLGVGRDGFLDREELALVCQAVGMEKMAEEIVQQLFEKLNVDTDGRISFEAFLQLFRGGGSWPQTGGNTELDEAKCNGEYQQCSTVPGQCERLGTSKEESQFLNLETCTGLVSGESVIEMWEAAGVPGPSRLLQDLGYSDTRQVSLSELSAILDEELLSLEHMRAERDKLRADILEANQRASLLAQEVDDHHARLEKSTQTQVRLLEQRHAQYTKQLTEQLTLEREQLAVQNQSLEKQLAALQEEEFRLRTDLNASRLENESLEHENHNLSEQLTLSQEVRTQLQKQVEDMQQWISELEGNQEQEQVLPLLEKVSELEVENMELRDHCDELTSALTSALTVSKAKKSLRSVGVQASNESEDGPGGAVKRRGDSPAGLQAEDEDSCEETSPRLGKVRRRCEHEGSVELAVDAVKMESLQIHSLSPGLSERGVEAGLDNSKDVKQCDTWIQEGEPCELDKLRSRVHVLEQELKVKNDASKVFQIVRQQALQELMGDSDLISSQSLNTQRTTNRISSATNLALEIPALNGLIPIHSDRNTKDVEQLEQHCRNLKTELDQVKIEIVKILTEKKACSRENCALKNHISELRNKFPIHSVSNVVKTNSLTSSEVQAKDMNSSLVGIILEGSVPDCVEAKDVWKRCSKGSIGKTDYVVRQDDGEVKRLVALEGSELCKESFLVDQVQFITNETNFTKADKSTVTEEVRELTERLTVAEQSHAEVLLRCKDLESSLELLRQEYEKCEDYWAEKLDEERRLFDQEQAMTDDKFTELLSKIREYEEMFGSHDNHSDDSDRLSTIEERASLEKQVTDLEEEYEELRRKAEQEQIDREQELETLRHKLQSLENKTGSRQDVSVQVSELDNGSWESDQTYIVELNGIRKAVPNGRKHNRLTQSSARPLSIGNGHCSESDASISSCEEDVRRLHNLRDQLGEQCHSLQRQKDVLAMEAHRRHLPYPVTNSQRDASRMVTASQACQIDLNVLQTLNSRLRHQEQQCRQLQAALKLQQQQSDSLLKRTWQQQREELTALRFVLHSTQEKLQQQAVTCNEQVDQMRRTDVLVKDLYVENSYLVATVQQLEQRCQVFVKMSNDSSSV
uniref:EF-hand domain-containing protein n=1 Tax=Timema douglasi TaxID=61478 RepID=A0A7R8ZAE3_TIMDO|nr:unnamed protein product [Timema douglasi]